MIDRVKQTLQDMASALSSDEKEFIRNQILHIEGSLHIVPETPISPMARGNLIDWYFGMDLEEQEIIRGVIFQNEK